MTARRALVALIAVCGFSNVVVVRVAPRVELRRSVRFFTVVVSGHGFLCGKRVALQRRTRAVLPRTQAAPCFLPGVSNTVGT